MYTPEEIRNIEFTKSLGGYKTAEVDPFIDKCADTLEALIKEKEELSKKLEVLADKLVEYRNDEDSIRSALLSAQRLGDTVVREANHKAGLILEDANIKAGKITEIARRNIQEEEAELQRIKREVASFKSRMLSIYREHLSLIDVLPEDKEETEAPAAQESPAAPPEAPVETAPPAAEEPVPMAEAGAFAPVAEPAEQAGVPAVEPFSVVPPFSMHIPEIQDDDVEVTPVVPKEVPAAAGVQGVRPNPRFANLKFGAEYDITEDDEEDKSFFKRKK